MFKSHAIYLLFEEYHEITGFVYMDDPAKIQTNPIAIICTRVHYAPDLHIAIIEQYITESTFPDVLFPEPRRTLEDVYSPSAAMRIAVSLADQWIGAVLSAARVQNNAGSYPVMYDGFTCNDSPAIGL